VCVGGKIMDKIFDKKWYFREMSPLAVWFDPHPSHHFPHQLYFIGVRVFTVY